MKRLALILGGIISTALFASAASAADLPRPAYKAPAYYAPGFNWSGFYVGINGGYGWGTASVTDPLFSFSADLKGWMGGGTVGYNVQSGSLVYGLEGDFDISTVKGTNVTACGTPGCEIKNTWLATGRGRIGYAFDRWLPFVTGGAAYGKMSLSNGAGQSESKSRLGYTLGGGVEYAFMGAWSVKAEYLYVDLGKFTCSPATCGPDTTYKAPLNIARLGVNYRF